MPHLKFLTASNNSLRSYPYFYSSEYFFGKAALLGRNLPKDIVENEIVPYLLPLGISNKAYISLENNPFQGTKPISWKYLIHQPDL
jgi:hypothetical protein